MPGAGSKTRPGYRAMEGREGTMQNYQNYDLKQGTGYDLPVTILQSGENLDVSEVEKIEFMIGRHIRREYPREVSYDPDTGVFGVPVTQEETLAIRAAEIMDLDVRVKFLSGAVIGAAEKPVITIDEAYGREVL